MGEGGSAVRARLLMKSSTEDLEDLMKDLDVNKDGRIDYEGEHK